jgi:hypothetical protein
MKGKARIIGGLLVLALVGAACGGNDLGSTGQQTPPAGKTGAMTEAAKTRVALDRLLGEHVVLAAAGNRRSTRPRRAR